MKVFVTFLHFQYKLITSISYYVVIPLEFEHDFLTSLLTRYSGKYVQELSILYSISVIFHLELSHGFEKCM